MTATYLVAIDLGKPHFQVCATDVLGNHHRLPYARLLATLQNYRFGWLCNDQQTFHPDREVGVCNRWTGYVSAGLVIDRLEAGPMLEILRQADHESLSAGVRRLRHHLIAENQRETADVIAALRLRD